MRSFQAETTVTGRHPGRTVVLPASRRGSPYAELSRQVKQAGLLERRPGYYIWKIAATSAALVAGWAAFVLVGDSWWQLAVAVWLAAVFTHLGFLGHDAGHRQITGSRRASHILGVLHGNLGIGLSYGWWVDKHNRHHAHPNTEDADPDIMLGALAFTAAQARAGRGVARFAHRYQAYLFLPMTAVALVLSPVRAVVFILVQQGLFGLYLGSSFAPNHKGMPILAAGDRSDFLRRQVLTSRNVRAGWLTDFALGGLNYQIEHHLFPSMPRPNLRRSQALVRAFCERQGLPYCETSLAGSYAQALRHLNTVGRPVRGVPGECGARRGGGGVLSRR